MQIYELAYLILPNIPEEDLGSVVDKIKDIVSKNGGDMFDGEDPFKYPLSYTISKTVGSKKYVVDEAFIGWLKFKLEPEKISNFKSGVEKISEVLRFLIVKAPRKTEFTFTKAKAAVAEKNVVNEEGEVREVSLAEEVVVE